MVDRKAHPCMHKPNCIRLTVALAWRFHSVYSLRRGRKTKKRVVESTVCTRVEGFSWSGSWSIGRPTPVLICAPIESQPLQPKASNGSTEGRAGKQMEEKNVVYSALVTRSKSTMIVISAPPTDTFSHLVAPATTASFSSFTQVRPDPTP